MQTEHAINMKNQRQDEGLPRKFPQEMHQGTRWKYVFLNNSLLEI